MKTTYSIATFGLTGLVGAFCATATLKASLQGTPPANAPAPAVIPGEKIPRIQFATNFFDFGKITAPGSISGVFKFKNVGEGILKVDPPKAGCDCTESKIKPDTLAPGESGEIIYTITLDHALNGKKDILVHSNDPKTPDVHLIMQMDYTPLYEASPKALRMFLPAGKEEAQGSFTVTRTDGKPLQIERLTTSREWISAAFDPSFKPQDNTNMARINVTVRRPSDPPSLINATVQLWNSNLTARPMQTVFVAGEILGELAAVPPRLYWVIPDFGPSKTNYPAESLTRTIQLKSVLGRAVELKNPTSNIKGMSVQIVPKDAGKLFDLVVKFDELPQEFVNGKVTVETSLASLPKLEVPMTISVPAAK
jgi:hypothetical protein